MVSDAKAPAVSSLDDISTRLALKKTAPYRALENTWKGKKFKMQNIRF